MSLRKRLENNLSLKILGLAFALLIWGLVRNQADPPVLRHRTLPVEVAGVPDHLAVAAVTPSQVAVTLYGRSSALQQFDRSGFRIIARVTETNVRATRVQVEPENVPPGIEVRDLSPLSVRVELDAEVSASRPVFVELRGNPAEGFTASTPQVRPNEVTLSGPSRQVEKVTRVVAEVDISGRSTSDPLVVPLLARDAASLLVPNVVMNPDQVQVTVPFRRIDSVTVPVVPVLSQVPQGYQVQSVTVRPVVVTVTGAARILGGLDTVQTAPISMAGSPGRTSYTVPVRLPAGANSSSASVVVTIVLGRAQRGTTAGSTPRTTEPAPAEEDEPEKEAPPARPPVKKSDEPATSPTVTPPADDDEPPAKAAPRLPPSPRTPARGPRPEPKGD